MTPADDELPLEVEDELAEILFRAPQHGEPRPETGCEDGGQRLGALMRKYPALAARILERARELGRATSPASADTDGMPARLGPYRVLRRLGEGGFGVVYLAEHTESAGRRVAVKVLKPGMDSQRILRSFRQESCVLAAMSHPCIATMLDSGTTSEGRAYFVMDFIDGPSLTEFCTLRALEPAARIELFRRACQGVQHAHQKAVIHRDLKPGNILVSLHGGEPMPRIIDFGLARALDPDVGGGWSASHAGERRGTLHYMSPEQLAQHKVLQPGQSIDTRSDVYSLGVVLYELLTGRVPFPVDPHTPIAELERQILEDVPTRPSTRAEAGRRNPFSADLDWIVLRALEKDPERRYASPIELARDLERCVRHEPVDAGPPTKAYRLRKFVRRHRAAVATSSLIALALVGGAIGTSTGFLRASRNAVQAAEQRDRADRVAAFHVGQLRRIDPATLGLDLRADLLERVGADPAEPAQTGASSADFERSIAGVNFTDFALSALDQAVFQPALAEVSSRFSSDPLLEAELLQTLATTMLELGLPRQARAPQERALALRSALLEPTDADRLESLGWQAELLDALGEPRRALELARRAVELNTLVHGADDPSTWTALDNEARYLFALGDARTAREIHERVYEARRAALGDEAPDTLAAMNNLAGTLRELGELEAARRLQERVLALELRRLGPSDQRTLGARNNLAVTLGALGEHELARELHVETLQRLRDTVGEEHPRALDVAFNLAGTLGKLGRFEEAFRLARRVLDVRTRVLGERHLDTLDALGRVGHALYLMRDFESAREAEERVFEGYRAHLGDRHARTLHAATNLAGTVYAQGDLDRARSLQEHALEVYLSDWGEQYAELPITMTNLARIRRHQGDLAGARELLERALLLCSSSNAPHEDASSDCAPIVEALAGLDAVSAPPQ